MTSRKDILIAILITLGIIDAGLYAIGPLLQSDEGAHVSHISHIGETTGTSYASEPLQPIPQATVANPPLAELGKKLFHDPRLSKDNRIACSSCHNLAMGGADGQPVSTGISGQSGALNASTVFNCSLNTHLFWDGRASTLEEQISGPINHPKEMGTEWPAVIAKLKTDQDYRQSFDALFADGITAGNIALAIAEFERTLLTPNARFDRFLKGEATALNSREKQGYVLFKTYGCASCHQGAAVGGNMFERLGSVRNYFADHPGSGPEDLGRYNVTHDEAHRHYFKVPSLRNVARTAPYFHNGSAASLGDAVRIMSYYNLGVQMPEQDVDMIVEFLNTLSGEYAGHPL